MSVCCGEAVTVASNDEAARLNDRIRDERITHGDVDTVVTAAGSDGLSIGRGDLFQTRKNRTDLGVANRQQWIVQRVEQDGSLWVRDACSGRKREHTLHLPAEKVRDHAHPSYAATAYGVQGVTVPASHTVLGEQMGGAAVYVGMTRGRETNTLHLVAEDMADTRAQFIEAMEHDRADRGLADATERRAEDDPRVTDAARSLVAAQTEQAALKDRHDRERLALLAQELGAERVRRDPIRGRFIRPEREARNAHAHAQATEARHEAGELRGLPPEEAAAVIEAKQAAAEQTQQLSADRARRLRGTFDRASAQTELRRDGPSLGL